MTEAKLDTEESKVYSVCMDHVLSIDQGFRDALAVVRNRFFETKRGVYDRDDTDFDLPVTVIIDISVAPDYVLRGFDEILPEPSSRVRENGQRGNTSD